MENTNKRIVYAVNSDLDDRLLYAEFETEEAAMAYAKRNLDNLPHIDRIEAVVDENGNIEELISFATIWDHTMVDGEEVETEEDVWDMMAAAHEEEEANKHVIGDTTWFESLGNLVEDLEENEDEVECKECFDLYPKSECIKLAVGYICPICAEGGSVDEETFKQEFPEYEKFSDANEMIPEEPAILADIEKENENELISTPEEAIPFLVKDEEEAIAGYEMAEEVIEDSDLENKEEILDTLEHIKEEEEEHIEELLELVDIDEDEVIEDENDPISEGLDDFDDFDIGPQIDEFEDLVDFEVEDPEEELTEHINEARPAIESEQELHGIDNAVVKCKAAKVVSHSEDEKPVDCEGKKKPLEKPLTESRQNPFHEAIFEAIDYLTEFEYIFPVPKNISADTWEELKDDINYGLSSEFEIAEIIMEYLDKDLSYSRKHPEIFEDDPQSELTLETYNKLKRAYDRATAEYKAKYPEDFTEATHAKYAKPEGDRVAAFNNALTYAKKDGVPYIYGYSGRDSKFFALEQPIKVAGDISEAEKEFRGRHKNCQVLHVAYPNKSFVESYDFTPDEMEEYGIDEEGNSLTGYDTWVRCNWCKKPYPDSECAFEVNLGWLCDRCQEEIRYHGGPLTIKDYPTEEDIAATLENQ